MRRFSGRILIAALAVVGGYVAALALSRWMRPTPAGIAERHGGAGLVEPLDAQRAGAGDSLVREVRQTLDRWPFVAARFRQILHIGETPLSGAGEYWQRGVGNQRRTCWQWQTIVAGDEKATFAQILDKNGRVWTDSHMPGKRVVTRVDLARFRRELGLAQAAKGEGGEVRDLDGLEVYARGGLSQLVAELGRCFTFGAPAPQTCDGRPAVAVLGHWREDCLARQWPGAALGDRSAWPLHLPHHVVIVIGRDDWFPYVIEYRRAADAAMAKSPDATSPVADPLARYEFYAVSWTTPASDQIFEFNAPEVEWRDVTARLVERLRPAAPAAPESAARPTVRRWQ